MSARSLAHQHLGPPSDASVSTPVGWQASVARILDLLGDIHAKVSTQAKSNLTVAEVASSVCRSELTVRRWIKEGKIHGVKVAGDGPKGRWLIPRAELSKLIAVGLGRDLPDQLAGD